VRNLKKAMSPTSTASTRPPAQATEALNVVATAGEIVVDAAAGRAAVVDVIVVATVAAAAAEVTAGMVVVTGETGTKRDS
jgi:hypothetical protein